jgi:hypothetical protein
MVIFQQLLVIHVIFSMESAFHFSAYAHSEDTCEQMERNDPVHVVLRISYRIGWFGDLTNTSVLNHACVHTECTRTNFHPIAMNSRSPAHHSHRKSMAFTVNFDQSYADISAYASQLVHGMLNVSIQFLDMISLYVVPSASSHIQSLLLSYGATALLEKYHTLLTTLASLTKLSYVVSMNCGFPEKYGHHVFAWRITYCHDVTERFTLFSVYVAVQVHFVSQMNVSS